MPAAVLIYDWIRAAAAHYGGSSLTPHPAPAPALDASDRARVFPDWIH